MKMADPGTKPGIHVYGNKQFIYLSHLSITMPAEHMDVITS